MSESDHDPSPEALLPPPALAWRDRSTASLLFGIFVVALGFCCLGMVAAMGIGIGAASALPTGRGISLRSAIPAATIYLVFAGFLFSTGIGSMMLRRWARALLAALSWIWLGSGALALLFVFAILPKFSTAMAAAVPPGQVAPPMGLMVGCMLAAVILIYIAVPLPLALFYNGRNVRATFEAKDRPRWTDRLPTPLLGLFIVLAFSTASVLALPWYGSIPALGRILTGTSALLFSLIFAAVTGAGTWWVWRRSILGWWVAVALWAFGAISALWTFTGKIDWNAYYAQMGMNEQQTRMTAAFSPDALFASPVVRAIILLTWIGIGVLLVWLRKFFGGEDGEGSIKKDRTFSEKE